MIKDGTVIVQLLREEGYTDTPGKETKGTLEMYLDAITKPMTLVCCSFCQWWPVMVAFLE